MRAIMTVTGKDHTGIVASVSVELARLGVNILDISQTIMDEYFTMILMVELNEANNSVKEVKEAMKKLKKNKAWSSVYRQKTHSMQCIGSRGTFEC